MKSVYSLLSALIIVAAIQTPAHALLAGVSPDSPGARVDPNTLSSPWAGVGSITINGSTFTGTLIAPGYVLTAGHVAYGVDPSTITFNLNAGGDLSQKIGATAVYTAPGFSGFNPNNLANDLAIIQLAQAVSGSIPTYNLYRNPLVLHSTLTFVGYGASGNGDVGITVGASPSVKRVGENNADMFVSDPNGVAAIYEYDFDGPNFSTNVMGGGTLGNDLETTVGSGDSGSPAFYRDANGKLWLAGVNTFSAGFAAGQVAGTFGTGGGGIVLSDYMQWIDSVVTPVPEPKIFATLLAGLGLLGFMVSSRRIGK